jgi:hypothetical protein
MLHLYEQSVRQKKIDFTNTDTGNDDSQDV